MKASISTPADGSRRTVFHQWVGPKERGTPDAINAASSRWSIVIRQALNGFDPSRGTSIKYVEVLIVSSAKHYDEMAEQFITQLENGDIAEASIPLVVTLRLAQITSGHVGIVEPHPTNPDKQVSRSVVVGNEKITALREILVEEVIEKEEPVIIVARWKHDMRSISLRCVRGCRYPRSASGAG